MIHEYNRRSRIEAIYSNFSANRNCHVFADGCHVSLCMLPTKELQLWDLTVIVVKRSRPEIRQNAEEHVVLKLSVCDLVDLLTHVPRLLEFIFRGIWV